MLAAVSSFTLNKDEREGETTDQSFSIMAGDDIPEFLLDVSIDFDDLFMGINDEDILPDLEMDPDLLADFSLDVSDLNLTSFSARDEEDEDRVSDYGSGSSSSLSPDQSSSKGAKINELSCSPKTSNIEKGRRSKVSGNSKNNNPHGKRKVKVDWTPDLHRRFVQAVEQLGVDKAVPSRILELMGIDCLTRHNIASHLQKYRSHRKHLLAREAEAANWNQRRQLYGTTTGVGGKNMSPWLAPTMGFPPMAAPPPPPMQHFRPLHVWGQPSADQSMLMHMWPKHIPPSPSPPSTATWPSPPTRPHLDPFWHSHQYQRAPATPGFPAPVPPMAAAMATTRFAAPTVPGIPHHHHHHAAMYRPAVDPGSTRTTAPNPPADFHPSKESIDAAIGDALSKPWLPLPIGLKSPSLDSVMGELQRQGVPKIPPTTCV
ncbi:transcription activator GLK1-like [Impatiens glandulifera]|uniref:transcription activator GLK1-like n=1 Tax=Impatiens glandulifera TaxID=253017 RepID=UPI001FB10F78|nr:transcription activator GLK1-like [Impatiens glandulifera]